MAKAAAKTGIMAGLGATDTPVGSGQPAPGDPRAVVLARLVASLGGAPADVLFAELVPGSVGLYRAVVRVPANAVAGNLQLVITQSGVTANVTTLPVGP